MPYSILLIDIDKFKHWNDGYGHAIGDEALRHFTRTAVSRIETSQLLARTGGDEFCLLLPGKAETDASETAARLVSDVRSHDIRVNDEKLKLTVSIGVAVYDPDSQDGYNEILAKADAALYQSKDNGRDRFTVFNEKDTDLSEVKTPARFRVI